MGSWVRAPGGSQDKPKKKANQRKSLISTRNQGFVFCTDYNQVVKQLHTAFGEKKALAMLYKLEQETIELSKIGRDVLRLCEQFKKECLSE